MKIDNNFNMGFNNRNNIFKNNLNRKDKEKNGVFNTQAGGIHSLIKDDLEEKKLLRKIARGEKLSEKEKEKIREVDPNKLREAEAAKKKKDELERSLRSAKTEEERAKILANAKMEVAAASDKSDNNYAELLSAAIDKAESNVRKGKSGSEIDIEV